MNVIDAAHKTVHNPKHGGSPALAARMGMSSTVLNSKVNSNTDTHHLRLDEALTIMEHTGDHSIIQAMSHRLGGVFCKVEGDVTDASLFMTALETMGYQGDIMTEMQAALEDGRIDCAESDAICAVIQKTMATLQALSIQIKQACK